MTLKEEIDKDLIDPIIEPSSESLHRVVRSVLSTIPVFGGVAVEVFSSIIEPPISRRKTKWMVQVTDAINILLNTHGFNPNELIANDLFLTQLIHASQIAICNHQEEKLNYLKQAIINSALKVKLDDARQQYFLNLINELSIYHIKILKLFDDPLAYGDANNYQFKHMTSDSGYRRSTILYVVFPELKYEYNWVEVIWGDLFRKGLIRPDRDLNKSFGESLLFGCSTPLGKEFLSYITHSTT